MKTGPGFPEEKIKITEVEKFLADYRITLNTYQDILARKESGQVELEYGRSDLQWVPLILEALGALTKGTAFNPSWYTGISGLHLQNDDPQAFFKNQYLPFSENVSFHLKEHHITKELHNDLLKGMRIVADNLEVLSAYKAATAPKPKNFLSALVTDLISLPAKVWQAAAKGISMLQNWYAQFMRTPQQRYQDSIKEEASKLTALKEDKFFKTEEGQDYVNGIEALGKDLPDPIFNPRGGAEQWPKNTKLGFMQHESNLLEKTRIRRKINKAGDIEEITKRFSKK